jgi:flagellar M-ring protein FliF
LLTSTGDGQPSAGLDAQQLQYVNQIETGYGKRIVELLEPIVGRDNQRAPVAADIDVSQTEATSEEFKPNQGADANVTVRSKQTTEQAGSRPALASGVPGAASNQPPVAASAPVTGAAAPLHTAQLGNGTASGRRDATVNYEVDKTVRVTRKDSGTVRRLNAAVVVNNRSSTNAKGKVTQVPLSTDEIAKLTALVREGIGFDQARGDSVKVINAPFKVDPAAEPVEVPLWKQPEVLDMLRAAAVPASLAFVALLVLLGLVRPALKAAVAPRPPPAPGATLQAVVDDPQVLPALPAPKSVAQLEGARALAKDNPAAVASIVRGWVGGEAVPAKA